MRFLADESCDFSVVKALRSQGFDVLTICEVCPGAKDESVIEMAEKEGHVIGTEDKDFGRWAYFSGAPIGVVLLLGIQQKREGSLATPF